MGETLSQAVVVAVGVNGPPDRARTRIHFATRGADRHWPRCAILPALDSGAADTILGYDERGLPA